ncbi:MAG: hypothetical protein K4H23_05230 [Mollicutes bacterium PWAP]|nr:hypothetical protein [Mollicutes bacterium PWAP]
MNSSLGLVKGWCAAEKFFLSLSYSNKGQLTIQTKFNFWLSLTKLNQSLNSILIAPKDFWTTNCGPVIKKIVPSKRLWSFLILFISSFKNFIAGPLFWLLSLLW